MLFRRVLDCLMVELSTTKGCRRVRFTSFDSERKRDET